MRVVNLHRLCVTALLLAVITLAGCHSGEPTDALAAGATPLCAPCQAGLRGDLNGNGNPDITDAVGILRIIVGLDPANALAECDCDGATGITDAILVLRCLVGLDEWPIACGEMIGPDGQTLVWVAGGSFMMGSDAWEDELPVHRVTLDGFWIGQCEVTNAQYRAFCDATGRTFPSESDQGDNHPVICVEWADAQAYCGHHGYALPTEAQWEYAARGAAAPAYPWGNVWDQLKCCNSGNQGPGGTTFPVGSFPAGASWCGALDMAGNVFEWCADWYSDTYYQISPELDPPGPATGTNRVLRGGSWYDDDDFCRAAIRGSLRPSFTSPYSGFRVARGR